MSSVLTEILIRSFVGDGVIDKGHRISATCVQCSSEFEAIEGYKDIKGTRKPETLCKPCRETQQKEFWDKWRNQSKTERFR